MSEPSEEQATTKPENHGGRPDPIYEPEVTSSRAKVTWLGGFLRDYGTMATVAIFGIAGLIGLGSLNTKVATSQAEILRLRDQSVITVKTLSALETSNKQLVSIAEKQTVVLSQLGTQMANNTAVLAQLSKALDRLTGKLDSLQQTANENKNMLSQINERTKNMGKP